MPFVKFTKMEGLGNDYVYVHAEDGKGIPDPGRIAPLLSDRHRGIGGDGLIIIAPSESAHARMEMYNADGSRAAMCGNGIRCVAKFLHDRGIVEGPDIAIETDAGIRQLVIGPTTDGVTTVTVDMGEPILDRRRIPMVGPEGRVVGEALEVEGETFHVTALSMGNPHCVTYVEDVRTFDVEIWGPRLERHRAFPERANAEFVQVRTPQDLDVRVWERGTGETLACGSGACAAAVAGVLLGRNERDVRVHLPGGELHVRWDERDAHVYMTGPAREVFRGEFDTEALSLNLT